MLVGYSLSSMCSQGVASSRVWTRLRHRPQGSNSRAMIRKASQHLRRGVGMGAHDDNKHLLLHILDPAFLIQVLRILAQSAAQVWESPLPLWCMTSFLYLNQAR